MLISPIFANRNCDARKYYAKHPFDISQRKTKNSHYQYNVADNQTLTKHSSNNIITFYSPNISFGNKNLVYDFEISGKTYLDYIKHSNEKPENINHFLIEILNDEDKRDIFLEEVTNNPRDSKNIVKLLVNKLGGKVNFLKWYFAENGYAKSYEKFLHNKYDKARIY